MARIGSVIFDTNNDLFPELASISLAGNAQTS